MIKKILLIIVFTLFWIGIFNSSQTASNDREWLEKDTVIASTSFDWDQVSITWIRDYTRRSDTDYDANYYDKSFDIHDVQYVDFFLSTFAFKERIWHTFLSFWLQDWSNVVISIEARKEVGEEYTPLKGLFNQYELYYLIWDESDLIPLRTEVREDPVYQYRLLASPEQSQEFLLSLLTKANELIDTPVFYNTILDNCTSVLWKHANKVEPWTLWINRWLLLTWRSDFHLLKKAMIRTDKSKEDLRAYHRINEKVWEIVWEENFSVLLRE